VQKPPQKGASDLGHFGAILTTVEGLLVAHRLAELPPVPFATRGWTFPDEGRAALRIPGGYLVLCYRPPNPCFQRVLEVEGGPPATPLQRALATRAVGKVVELHQPGLDRVIVMSFSGRSGFVSTPPVRLIFELTGRNANLILTDPGGKILAIDRLVPAQQNRYRQLLPGQPYRPPPPYQKKDPRKISEADLLPLVGQPLRAVIGLLDGIGPRGLAFVAEQSGLDPSRPLTEEDLPRLFKALGALTQNPEVLAQTAPASSDTEALRRPLLAALEKEERALLKRLDDHRKNLSRREQATAKKRLAELLLAYAHQVPLGAEAVELPDFETGEPVRISLDPGKTPVENAEALFQSARKDEAAARRAEALLARTEANLKRVRSEIESLKRASPEELRRRLRAQRARPPKIGLHYRSPGGLEVWVGRNARENEALLRLARPDDLWFHAQGLPGSHVILRTGGKPAPLSDLLFAAQLAAYHSRARGEKNAPVDYTRRKHVRRVRKAPAGTVTYSQAKTLFVDASLPENVDTV